MKEQRILPGRASPISGMETTPPVRPTVGSLRFRRPDRSQRRLVPLSLEETIPPAHHVRVRWEVVERLDLSGFSAGRKVCAGAAGRPATDVRWLTALGLYAATAAWRTRLAGEEAPALYQERASPRETVNADLRTYRGWGPFLVRGLRKVRCVVLRSALAYNLMHFGQMLRKDGDSRRDTDCPPEDEIG